MEPGMEQAHEVSIGSELKVMFTEEDKQTMKKRITVLFNIVKNGNKPC